MVRGQDSSPISWAYVYKCVHGLQGVHHGRAPGRPPAMLDEGRQKRLGERGAGGEWGLLYRKKLRSDAHQEQAALLLSEKDSAWVVAGLLFPARQGPHGSAAARQVLALFSKQVDMHCVSLSVAALTTGVLVP